jgi:outer membrane protein
MTRRPPGLLAGCAGTLLLLLLTGCLFPDRSGVYERVSASRRQAYSRWVQAEHAEEDLPRLDGGLTIEDAVKVALRYNKDVERTLQERVKARAQVVSAYGEALPSVDLSAGYTRLDEVMTVDLGTTSFQVGDEDNWSYQFSLTQPLFKGGAIPAAIRGAVLFRCMTDETVRLVVQDVIMAVAAAYYDAVLAGHLYDVQQDALRFAEANLRDVAAREDAGVAIRYDRLRAELEVATVRAEMIAARNSLNRAQTALMRAMGASQSSRVDLVDRLAYAPLAASEEEAVEAAFMSRPELYQAEMDVRFQKEYLRGLYGDYLPHLEAWAWHMWAKPDPHESSMIRWGTQWQTGLRLTWSLFDGLRREGQVKQQKAVLRQSEISLADAEQGILEEIRNALLGLDDAQELVESQRLNLEQANEALRLVTIGAREGANTELEVLDARSALTRAQGLYYQALYAHAIARLNYQRAVGLLAPAAGSEGVPQTVPDGLLVGGALETPQEQAVQ